ncbi:MAG: 5-methyltetrahydropteroyltriglutamate--homocysteine S-methyltransferase [Acidobacteriota bacterium]
MTAESPFFARNFAPFRADHVGSLLRPSALKASRVLRSCGEMNAEELRQAEDLAIESAVRKQASLGLQGITDGEFRRAYWHFDFLGELDGVELADSSTGIQFHGGTSRRKILSATGKVGYKPHSHVEHFQFLRNRVKNFAGAVAKVSIPSPSVLHYRSGRKHVSESVYPDMTEYFHDVGQAFREAVNAFAAAGCEYLQLDEPNFAFLCDPEQREMLRDRGDDPDRLPGVYADLINAAIADRPSRMRVTMHLCRGNFRSMWIAQGGYEPVADVLFNQIDVNGYFMEWDSDRAGGFEPLRLVPKGKVVTLGILTTKIGDLEPKDFLKRRLDEASKFLPLDQLCLGPQCGFASTEEGNTLTEEEQWAKLARVVETARDVWGD